MAVSRRTLGLGALLGIAVVALIVTYAGSGSTPAATAVRTPPAGRNTPQADTAPPAEVNLKALGEERTEPADLGRNPFRFRPKPAPTPSQVARASQPAEPPTTPIQMAPAGPPPPPPITLKFIGVVEKADGTRIAVLSDGKRPISGREGEEIEGRYKILKIGEESIDIAYIDGRGRRTIPLTGQ
jgi:hypothetical protein